MEASTAGALATVAALAAPAPAALSSPASPAACTGLSWVWLPEGGVANYCVGEARAILQTAEGDEVAIVEMETVAGEPGCPLVRRGCSRLQWYRRDNETDCAERVVPLARVRRVIHVVPDIAKLTERKGFGASPAASDSPLAERLAMHLFLNVCYLWDI